MIALVAVVIIIVVFVRWLTGGVVTVVMVGLAMVWLIR